MSQFQVLKGLCREEKEIEIWKVRKLCLKGEISMSTWSRKRNWLFKKNAQLRKISEAQTEMDIRNWEHRNADIALLWNQSRTRILERLELYQTNQWADQAQREKINLCGELDMRNCLSQEHRARNCQEIEELRRICCEEIDKSQTIEHWPSICATGERNPSTVSSWLKFRISRTRWIPSPTQEIFTILRQRAALEHPTFPANPWISRAPEVCLAAILDCCSIHGIPWDFRKRFWKPTCSRRTSSALFENSRNWASSSCGLGSGDAGKTMEHESGVRRDPQSSSIPTARFERVQRTFVSYWRNLFSEWFDG